MRIAIDARLNAYRTGGIPEYTRQLLHTLAQVAPDDQFEAINHRRADTPVACGANIVHRRVWTPPHHRWEQILLPLELRQCTADVLHFPDFIPLFKMRTPTVITIHDLAFLRYPEILDAAARRYYGQIQRAVRHATAIIAVSHSTRRDIVELLGVDEARIEVIYEAAAAHFRPPELTPNAEREINGHRVRKNAFALFVGTLEPRKNVQTLLRALQLLRMNKGVDQPTLVIAGSRGWLDADLFDLVRQLGIADAVQFIGGVGADDLVWLYNACRVYLHPELYSGFGLPVLEALQSGAAVLAANTSSLPEVLGSAGKLLPPQDAAAWAEAWSRIWHDNIERDRLRKAGPAQAAQFSWRTAAERTLRVYQRIA